MTKNIRLFKPMLGDEELAAVAGCFSRSWVGLGEKVSDFEKAWKEKLGCAEAVGLNSATAALHLALAVFKFQRGKKVLVPSLTFSATASAALYNGLEPIFVDSDPITLGMDLEDLERKWTPDCVAVIPVHYAGHPVKMEELVPWARSKGLKIIEDCAHTTGAIYKGKRLGLWGDIGCYSFEEKKLMTTGDGGMICANDADLLRDIRAMRWVGIDKDNWKSAQSYTNSDIDVLHWYYEISILGYKYNMNDLAASIGLVQLSKLDNMNQIRGEVIKTYLNSIKFNSDVQPLLPYQPNEYEYQIFGVRVKNRNHMMRKLKAAGIATGCHYTPLSLQPLFSRWGNNCPFIEAEADSFITLPLHCDISQDDVEYIASNINAAIAE
jgi:perosamine synthetase